MSGRSTLRFVSDIKITRRELLAASATSAVLIPTLSGCGTETELDEGPKIAPPEAPPEDSATPLQFSPEDVSEDLDIFELGVQSGAMNSNSAIVWTYASDKLEKELIVWRETNMAGTILVAYRGKMSTKDGYIKTRVEGLGAGRYSFAFFQIEGEQIVSRSTIGSFRTAFAEGDLRPITIAGLTCSSMRNAPFSSLGVTAGLDADVYCHLGDMTYNDGAETKEDYRRYWRETLQEKGYLEALPKTGMYSTWDDHEITNNFDPERMAAEQPERLRAAKEAFFEHLPNDEGDNYRVWHSYRWGHTAEFFVLDSRSERRPSTRKSDKPIYISEEQMQWLKSGLKSSPCKYKVLLNSVPMTEFLGVWEAADSDRWQGYQVQRRELLDYLTDNKIKGVLFLSGDFHFGFVAKVERLGPNEKQLEIAVGPTANGPNPLAVLAETGDLSPDDLFPPDQFLHYSGSWAAATLIELDPLNEKLRVKHIDGREDRYNEILYETEIDFG